MPAKAPLDVDLEDKLAYGLTPIRLAYLAVALLAAFSIWSSQWALVPIRAAAAAGVVLIGAAVAWGRWRGRAADGWIVDVVVFVVANYSVEWNIHLRLRRRPQKTSVAGERSEPVVEPLAAAA